MKKKILSVLLAGSIVFGTMTTSVIAVNDNTVVEVIEIVNKHPLRGLIMGQLKSNIKTDKGIDTIKSLVNLGLSSEDKAELEKKGITTQDIHQSLDDMKAWDVKSREDLIQYVENGEIEKAKDLVKNQGKVETPQPEKPEVEKPETPKPETPEVEKPQEPETPEVETPEVEKPETPQVEVKFTDIKGHWAEENIKTMTELEFVSGITEDKFAPEQKVTRNQMVALIVRMLDIKTDADATMPFTDVKVGSWDYEAIKAGYNAKIVAGMSETTFEPNKQITREQMMVMMMNAIKEKNIVRPDVKKDLTKFVDHKQILDWAKESMQDAADLGLINGKNGNRIDPKGLATRAEAVTILKNAYDLIK